MPNRIVSSVEPNPNFLHIELHSPASVANLGSGYDCLAMAVDLWNHFSIWISYEEKERRGREPFVEINIDDMGYTGNRGGEGGIGLKNNNKFIRAFGGTVDYYSKHDQRSRLSPNFSRFIAADLVHQIRLSQINHIPDIRGLGSSSSAAVAGTVAAILYLKNFFELDIELDKPDFFDQPSDDLDLIASLATVEDHCPDNICACLAGGLTRAFFQDVSSFSDIRHTVRMFKTGLTDDRLRLVVLVPNAILRTDVAKKVLAEVPDIERQDAVFNLSRAACLPEIFRFRRYQLLAEATKDRLHQNLRMLRCYRLNPDLESSFIDLREVHKSVLKAGALGVAISGAGSSQVAFCLENKVEDVRRAFFESFVREVGVASNKIQQSFPELTWTVESLRILKPINNGISFKVTGGYKK
ncbi:MAG: hypothetical protein HQL56_08450 [Magnetococcales bacterium]|nr:hypothetical protein [Magnetococcales bacterium]